MDNYGTKSWLDHPPDRPITAAARPFRCAARRPIRTGQRLSRPGGHVRRSPADGRSRPDPRV